ncbi:MAG: glucuronyl hydrolase, partial [Paraprevotella sp.]|nr:glucuronyl hydrolase [Paraprevotella sp.]
MNLKNIAILFCCNLILGACHTQPKDEVGTALDYCHQQVERTLTELKTDKTGIDYTMMPRNIADTTNVWHLRKASKEEWCAGFWPG